MSVGAATGGHRRLPVEEVLGELRAVLTEQPNAVLVAPPGTGKTTVVPPALLDEPWLEGARIVVLEPRRLAARAAAARMASLAGEQVGQRFGYTVRHDRRVGVRTRVEVVTEGVLTRRLQGDPSLDGIGLVVLDELHERSLEADLALALLLDVQAGLRPDLRLLAMSATIDQDAVARLLGGPQGPAATLHAEAPLHPVELRWRPPEGRRQLDEHVAEVVQDALRTDPGDVLVFLPGRAEIARAGRRLRSRVGRAEVLELHGSVPPAEQDRILAPARGHGRRVILSTSIAETSLTVPGVRVVVDAGRRRTSAADPRTGLPSLVTTAVSQAGADQRAGRAGREGPGVCYRLWSANDHRHRDLHDSPEITRADLTGLVLSVAVWGVRDPASMRWLDDPPAHAVQRARGLLVDLDALDADGRPTATGRALAGMPMAPRLAAMVREAGDAEDLALEVAALIDVGGPGDAELAERVRSRRQGRAHSEVDRVLSQFRRELRRRGSGAATPGGPAEDDELEERVAAVALAGYADRVARRRGSERRRGAAGRGGAVYQLRHGGEVALDPGSALATHDWLVVLDLDAGTGTGRAGSIRLAAGLPAATARQLVATHGHDQHHVRWEPGSGAVATIATRLDAITVERRPWRDPDPEAVTSALVQALEHHGPAMLPRWAGSEALRSRVAFASALGLPCPGGEWPTWSDPHRWHDWESVQPWLEPALLGVRDQRDLDRFDVASVLDASLDRATRRHLDREVPATWTTPDGRELPLRYGQVDGKAASVLMSVRLQLLLGVDVQPTVSSLRVPVTVELLSPADRPVQRTTDLPGFWRGSYRQVRAEMRSRYRRHDWPEHPV